jgi:hypothetical protein
VRAVEFATTSKALLDRDRFRLLLSLEKAARRFADLPDGRPSDVGSAGVVVAYLVELGIGVRRCPPDELEWHFEPLTRLAVLHRDFNKEQMDEVLVIGTAAGVLKVAEAITAARSREQISRLYCPNQPLQDRIRHDAVVRTVNDLRNVEELRAPNENKTFTLFDPSDGAPVRGQESTDLALKVAESLFLEPREQSVIHPTDKELLKELHTKLLCTSEIPQDQQKQESPA